MPISTDVNTTFKSVKTIEGPGKLERSKAYSVLTPALGRSYCEGYS